MNIEFYFQGENVYSISLPDNTLSASFELDDDVNEVYDSIKIHLPFISEINFKDN